MFARDVIATATLVNPLGNRPQFSCKCVLLFSFLRDRNHVWKRLDSNALAKTETPDPGNGSDQQLIAKCKLEKARLFKQSKECAYHFIQHFE